MGKPGIMLYFELRPCIQQMTMTEKGELLDAFMDYGEFGQTPELSEKLQMIWPLIRLKLDRDTERYERTVKSRRYATFVRESKKHNDDVLSYEQWEETVDKLISNDIKTDQNTTADIQTTNYKPQTTNHKPQTTNMGPAATPVLFSPPGKEDILSFCEQENCMIDAQSFLDYYTANGWMIGKSPMKDWKAAVRRWYRKENADAPTGKLSAWTVGEIL